MGLLSLMGIMSSWAFCHGAINPVGILSMDILSFWGIMSSWALCYTIISFPSDYFKEELSLLHNSQGLERNERSSFKLLSVAVRDSHEKERSQGEKTKYYSLIFSLVGVCVGGLISVFTNERRMRKMRQVAN